MKRPAYRDDEERFFNFQAYDVGSIPIGRFFKTVFVTLLPQSLISVADFS